MKNILQRQAQAIKRNVDCGDGGGRGVRALEKTPVGIDYKP